LLLFALPIAGNVTGNLNQMIVRLLIILILISQVGFAQSKIQHEPERIFNKLIIGQATIDFAKEHKLKKVTFYRDTLLSSLMEFDTNGNFITKIGMENNAVRKSTYKWDDQNRMIEKKHYSTDGSFRYGYYYKYKDGAQLMYKIEDSLLFRKRTSIENENISTYSEYDKNGKIILKNVYVKDSDMKWLLETRFQNDKIYVQYHYEYLDDKKYVTKVQFDKNGTKVSEKRYLDEVKTENGLEHYTKDDERLFRIDSFDRNGNLIEMKLLDEDGNLTRIENYKYSSKGQLKKLTKENLSRGQKLIYSYKYDKTDKVELVKKELNGNLEIFRYEYETF
jgi:hypothetical protein